MRSGGARGSVPAAVVALDARRRGLSGAEAPPVFLEEGELRLATAAAAAAVDGARTLSVRSRCLREMTLVWFILRTGAKPGEAAAVRVRDLDLRSGTAWLGGPEASGLGRRAVGMGPDLRERLSAYVAESGVSGSDRLFGTHRHSVTRSVRRLLLSCGVAGSKANPGALRNTFAVRAIRGGVPLSEVARAMGWGGYIHRTLRYVPVAFPDMGEAWEMAERRGGVR